jgi:hypothetical protein
MVVRDIYGPETPESLGLDPDLTASCLAHAARVHQRIAADEGLSSDSRAEARQALRQDLAASVLQMVSFNIAQIACLNARLHGVERVFFAGFFLRSQPTVMSRITQAVHYWGKGLLQALFLRHEGYLGAIGSFLASAAVHPLPHTTPSSPSSPSSPKSAARRPDPSSPAPVASPARPTFPEQAPGKTAAPGSGGFHPREAPRAALRTGVVENFVHGPSVLPGGTLNMVLQHPRAPSTVLTPV